MIKKIIYINFQSLTEKTQDDFYLLSALEQGFKVEYWDVSNIYFPEITFPQIKASFIVYFNCFNDFENKIAYQSKEQTLFIPMISFHSRVSKIFFLLSKYNCRTALFARGMLPNPFLLYSVKSLLTKIRYAFNPKLLIAYLENRIYSWRKKMGFLKPYDLIFNESKFGIYTLCGIGYEIKKKRSVIVNVNSFDYDRYIATQNTNKIIEEKYCVFFDDYVPFHLDFAILEIKTVDPDNYYNSLNNFFKVVESKFNIEVVIAAHPKAEKYITENPFENRKIFFNKTAELTKFAEFTLVHASTAVSFAVLNRKPIIFLYSNPIKSIMPELDYYISNFSKTLGCPLINTDNYSLNEINIEAIDQSKYLDYKYKYLTSKESEGRKSSDIFIEAISQLS